MFEIVTDTGTMVLVLVGDRGYIAYSIQYMRGIRLAVVKKHHVVKNVTQKCESVFLRPTATYLHENYQATDYTEDFLRVS